MWETPWSTLTPKHAQAVPVDWVVAWGVRVLAQEVLADHGSRGGADANDRGHACCGREQHGRNGEHLATWGVSNESALSSGGRKFRDQSKKTSWALWTKLCPRALCSSLSTSSVAMLVCRLRLARPAKVPRQKRAQPRVRLRHSSDAFIGTSCTRRVMWGASSHALTIRAYGVWGFHSEAATKRAGALSWGADSSSNIPAVNAMQIACQRVGVRAPSWTDIASLVAHAMGCRPLVQTHACRPSRRHTSHQLSDPMPLRNVNSRRRRLPRSASGSKLGEEADGVPERDNNHPEDELHHALPTSGSIILAALCDRRRAGQAWAAGGIAPVVPDGILPACLTGPVSSSGPSPVANFAHDTLFWAGAAPVACPQMQQGAGTLPSRL